MTTILGEDLPRLVTLDLRDLLWATRGVQRLLGLRTVTSAVGWRQSAGWEARGLLESLCAMTALDEEHRPRPGLTPWLLEQLHSVLGEATAQVLQPIVEVARGHIAAALKVFADKEGGAAAELERLAAMTADEFAVEPSPALRAWVASIAAGGPPDRRPHGYFDDPRGRRAEELCFRAERASGDEAKRLYAEAALLETAVARDIPPTEPRIRGVLAVSAVAMWRKAGNHGQVIELCGEFLREKLPSEYQGELETMLRSSQGAIGL